MYICILGVTEPEIVTPRYWSHQVVLVGMGMLCGYLCHVYLMFTYATCSYTGMALIVSYSYVTHSLILFVCSYVC